MRTYNGNGLPLYCTLTLSSDPRSVSMLPCRRYSLGSRLQSHGRSVVRACCSYLGKPVECTSNMVQVHQPPFDGMPMQFGHACSEALTVDTLVGRRTGQLAAILRRSHRLRLCRRALLAHNMVEGAEMWSAEDVSLARYCSEGLEVRF